MNLQITQAMFGVRIPVTKPIPEFLLEVGEIGIRKLVSDHYDTIKTSDISHLFPMDAKEFEDAKKHSSDFFIQICGGPRYFDDSRGAPRMIARHAPFKITSEARRIWLESYIVILSKLDMSDDLKLSFWTYIDIFSIWMMNTNEGGPTFKMKL